MKTIKKGRRNKHGIVAKVFQEKKKEKNKNNNNSRIQVKSMQNIFEKDEQNLIKNGKSYSYARRIASYKTSIFFVVNSIKNE